MFTVIYEKETGFVKSFFNGKSDSADMLKAIDTAILGFIYVDDIPEMTNNLRQKLKVEGDEVKVFNLELSPEEDRQIRLYEINAEIRELKRFLSSTDYKAIKFAEGVMTDEEYFPIKFQREEWRAEINRLEAELKALSEE